MIRKLLTRRILLTAMIFIVTMLVSLMANVSANAEYKKTDIKLETANTNDVFRTQMTDLVLKASDINDLYTMQVELCYDPGRLSLTQSGIKNLAWNNQNGYSAIKLDASAGRVNIIYSQKGKKPGVSGNKDLIGLKFETLRIGKATVEVSNIKLIDSYGNAINTKTSAVSKEVDVKPNPLIVELTGEMGQDGWYVSPVTVEITDIDAERIIYTLNGIQNNYVQPITISEIGINNLKVRTDDGYGYIKEKENVLKIDYEGPVLKVNNQNYAWQNSDIFILPEFSDGKGSGIKQSYYQWTDSTDEPSQWEEYNHGVLTMETEGIRYLHTKAVDIAGNTSQAVFGPYKLDKTVPQCSVDCDMRENWENADVYVTPSFTDEGGSQIKYMGYEWSQDQLATSTYIPYTTGVLHQTNDGVWYLHLKVEDWAGNVKTMTEKYSIELIS